MLRRKAEIDSELKLLDNERQIKEAETQIRTMENISEQRDDTLEAWNIEEEDSKRRTAEYVVHSRGNWIETIAPCTDNKVVPPYTHNEPPLQPTPLQTIGYETIQSHPLNSNAPVFVPDSKGSPNTNICNEFSKFLVKRDLLLSRLTRYDDRPDMFIAWKSSFKNVMRELDVSSVEEVDLLVKWLGPNSSNQAMRIRASNTDDPDRCLNRIWQRLEDRFGSAEVVEDSLKRKIGSFPKLSGKDNKQLFDLADIVAEIESVMNNDKYKTVFGYYNSSSGVNPIVGKLPHNLQERWTTEANKYKTANNEIFPPFTVFSSFIQRLAKVRNDPSFTYDAPETSRGTQRGFQNPRTQSKQDHIISRRTDTRVASDGHPSYTRVSSDGHRNQYPDRSISCPIHGTNHALNACRYFRSKPIAERKEFLRKNGICFRCCKQQKHLFKDCTERVKCFVCNSSRHPSALHVDTKEPDYTKTPDATVSHGGERSSNEVKSTCTQICGSYLNTSKSCAKIVPAKVYPQNRPQEARVIYCLIDDQSNRSLATPEFFDAFHENGPSTEYVLSSCSGKFTTSGRKASNYVIESLDNSYKQTLPELIECENIPNNREEIPSPSIASKFPHLRDIAEFIHPVQNEANIEVLIGRDLISAHLVLDQRFEENGLPYAQKLPLGWVIIGETCLGIVHQPTVINVSKTFVIDNGRTTHLEPCPSKFTVKTNPIFEKTSSDEKPDFSIEDRKFIEIMDSNFMKDVDGKWVAPLPFREHRPTLTSNKEVAIKRARSFDFSLRKNPTKQKHVDFMQKMMDKKHAELAPKLTDGSEHWYLPFFSVYHPRKPESVRVVFDSAATHNNLCLNDVLLKGPDLTNSLLGVLLRFRKEAVAVTGDIEQMFYNFKVREDHRDFLRFVWHENNDIKKTLIDYRMLVHVFGNTASPAISTYGLRKSVEHGDQDVKDFVNDNFYVDDGLVSCQTAEEAISLLKRTQITLSEGGRIRLHKIASNDTSVLEHFDNKDLSKDLKDLDLSNDELPMQRSLGLSWNVAADQITFQVSTKIKPFTRRGVLSTINGIFDPLGLAAPVVIRGKLLLREMLSLSGPIEWDEPLDETHLLKWKEWVNQISDLDNIAVPRMYCGISFKSAVKREVLVFSDASKEAIGAVAYLKIYDINNHSEVSFLMGKAKVAPQTEHTIPRLELCGALLAVEIADAIKENLDIDSTDFKYYTDSQVVLGYITNEKRRFYVYVSNRVSRIRSSSDPSQWNYVPTEFNPADIATRSIKAKLLQDSAWLKGPTFPLKDDSYPKSPKRNFDLVDENHDKEIRPVVTNIKTSLQESRQNLGTDRFSRFSEWMKLVSAIAYLQRKIRLKSYKGSSETKNSASVDFTKAERLIIQETQKEAYGTEIQCIQDGKQLPRNSSLLSLRPIVDKSGVLRVGGRLTRNATISDSLKQPIIIPKRSHIALLLIRYFHINVSHQGRQITEGAIRSGGYWIVGAKRLINTMIHSCVICRKLRGKCSWQQMADLPKERLAVSPAFTYVGVDTFGPWQIIYRRTRGGQANQKRWALLFTCLVTRAIHIELIEELSSSCFINALRRFIAIRGPVQQFRSDRGTNFVGATEDLAIHAKFVENDSVQHFLTENKTTWLFNPPHASHMGGAWERLIGVSRRILDSMLLKNRFKDLTHDILSTFMAEVTAIVNSRPLISVSSDPESPEVLTPSLLLTQKSVVDIQPFPEFGSKDIIRHQWKFVQSLADEFWHKWQNEYLNHLQIRQKWKVETPNMKVGTLVLMKDNDCARTYWPTAIVEKVFPSTDEKVRTVEICIIRDGKRINYVRPVTQLISLLEFDD